MIVISYNINGLRAAIVKDFIPWLQAANPDILCLQETKISDYTSISTTFKELGYHSYWFSATKKGYSGVAILSKEKALAIERGIGIESFDKEGRLISIELSNTTIVNTYMPAWRADTERQKYKNLWLNAFSDFIDRKNNPEKSLIVCGDFNISHKAIDSSTPWSGSYTSVCQPFEQQWMDNFLSKGFVDSFRYFNSEPHNYTWWSYHGKMKQKNIGWRIDYVCVSEKLKNRLKRSMHLKLANHSDHCPVLLELE